MSSTKVAKVAKTSSSTKSKSSSSTTPQTVSDFTVLPLTLPTVSGLPEQYSSAKHYLYIKPHTPTHTTASAERSLFLANVPIDASESNIRSLFAEKLSGSRVESVDFDSSVPSQPQQKRWKDVGNKAAGDNRGKKRKRNDEDIVAEGVVEDAASKLPSIWGEALREGGGTAVVVFVDERSCKGAWKEIQKCVKEGSSVEWKGGEAGMLGLARYTTHHSLAYPSKESLQTSINAYLVQFNRAELARNRLRSKQRSVPDEDGFITVVRGGRTGPARLEEAEKKKVELEERKKKNGVRDDFYRFQTREKRKEAEGELRRKFEVDRRRVEEMRARRGVTRPQA
jgi:ribosomal RNA-processing protein 7